MGLTGIKAVKAVYRLIAAVKAVSPLYRQNSGGFSKNFDPAGIFICHCRVTTYKPHKILYRGTADKFTCTRK